MKKILLIIAVTAALVTASCKQEYENWYSAAYELSGEWVVTYDGVDEDGNVTEEDPWGLGHFQLLTYNTAANSADTMWIDDDYNSWEFKVKTGINVNAKTFSVTEGEDLYNGALVTITNGKILPGAATTPTGSPADSIVFTVVFDDDPYVGTYWDAIRISGYRKTGFLEDEEH